MNGSKLVLHLFTPRWHGFAKWRLEKWTPQSNHTTRFWEVEGGWMRRPRGAQYQRFERVTP